MDVDAEPFAEGLDADPYAFARGTVSAPLLKSASVSRIQSTHGWAPVMVTAVRLTTRMRGFYRRSQSYTTEDAEDTEGSSPQRHGDTELLGTRLFHTIRNVADGSLPSRATAARLRASAFATRTARLAGCDV